MEQLHGVLFKHIASIDRDFETILLKQMQRHIGKVKIKNPIKYQELVQRAGGNITHCCSCHVEVKACEGIISPTPQRPTPQPPKKF